MRISPTIHAARQLDRHQSKYGCVSTNILMTFPPALTGAYSNTASQAIPDMLCRTGRPPLRTPNRAKRTETSELCLSKHGLTIWRWRFSKAYRYIRLLSRRLRRRAGAAPQSRKGTCPARSGPDRWFPCPGSAVDRRALRAGGTCPGQPVDDPLPPCGRSRVVSGSRADLAEPAGMLVAAPGYG